MERLLAARWMAAYLLVLFALTLGMFYHPHAPRNFVPFRTIEHDIRSGGVGFVVNFLGNVTVFLPMGWLLPSLLGPRRSAVRVVVLSLAVSLFVEVLQGISGRRVADVDDLILNSLGGLLGYGLWVGFERISRLPFVLRTPRMGGHQGRGEPVASRQSDGT